MTKDLADILAEEIDKEYSIYEAGHDCEDMHKGRDCYEIDYRELAFFIRQLLDRYNKKQ